MCNEHLIAKYHTVLTCCVLCFNLKNVYFYLQVSCLSKVPDFLINIADKLGKYKKKVKEVAAVEYRASNFLFSLPAGTEQSIDLDSMYDD